MKIRAPFHLEPFYGQGGVMGYEVWAIWGVAAHQRERDRPYRAYDENPTTDNYSRLTAPFNSYRRD